MNNLLKLFLNIILLFPFICFSQTAEWKFSYQKTNNKQFEILIDIAIPEDFHMYSFDQAKGGPIPAEVNFTLPQGVEKIGTLQYITPQPQEFFDDIFEINIRQLSGKVQWVQKFTTTTDIPESKISGSYSYQLCKDDGFCINPFPEDFSITIPATKILKDSSSSTINNNITITKTDSIYTPEKVEESVSNNDTITTTAEQQEYTDKEESTAGHSLFFIFLMGFLGGLLAFLTPCVFPMVPMTVSMFIKRNRNHAFRDVFLYGLSIVIIFVTLGLCITLLFGVDALNKLSTNPIFNLVFFVIFIIFAISFFGLFEIMLPTSLINYFDKKADSTNGFMSIFFMAFTLVLVSFSCTAMIIGTLLVESVVSNSIIGPLLGMLGFAIALSLPFLIFASVPSLLSKFAKSGSWMNDIKISLGFIELGFALKFLSKADLVAGWGILPRDLFIALWIILLIIWGLCILSVIRIGNTTNKPLSKIRIGVSILIFGFAIYLVPGFLGKPINIISGYLPPMSTQKIQCFAEYADKQQIQIKKKYDNIFHSPYNLNGFYDYEEGMNYAKAVKKPILLDFTGLGCENCRKIEMNIWSKPDILKIIKNDYVLISLYLDSREPLDSTLVREETYGGKVYKITTVGEHCSIFMMKNYHGLMQPYYVLLSPEGIKLCEPITYNEAKDENQYKEFLLKGLSVYNDTK